MPYKVDETGCAGPTAVPPAEGTIPKCKKEGCAFQIAVSHERHIQVYLVTVTTLQDFDVFIDMVTCINQDLIRF